MKKWLKISLISLGSLFGFLVIVFSLVCYILFTPARLTPLVNRFANEFVNADISVEKVDLSYFSVYPFVRLNITNILILERHNAGISTSSTGSETSMSANPEALEGLRDTLTFIPVAKAKLNFNQLVFHNNLILTQLELRGGVTNVKFDENGKFNWDIFPPSETTDTTSTALDSMFNKIDIQQIIITSGRVNYSDKQSGQVATIQDAGLRLHGSFIDQKLLSEATFDLKYVDFSDSTMNVQLANFQTHLKGDLFNKHVDVISEITMDSLNFKDKSMHVFFPYMTISLDAIADVGAMHASPLQNGKIRINTIVEQIIFDYENETLLNKPNLKLILSAEYFSENEKISIEKGEFFINDIAFKLAGNIEIRDSTYFPNLTFSLDTTRFSQIDELLPKQYQKMLLDYAKINDGEMFLNGTITGKYNAKNMPNVDMTFGLKNMDMIVQNSKIDTLNLLIDAHIRMNDLKNSTLIVHDFYYSGHLGTMTANAVVKGFTDNPHIETTLHTDLNLRRLYRMLSDIEALNGYRTRGNIHADLKANFFLKDAMDFSLENLEKIKLDGVVAIDSLLVRNRRDSLNLWADYARLRFGASADDDGERQGAAQFRVSVRLDSLDFAYKNQYTANIARLSAGYRYETANAGHTVNPQSARISFRGMRVRMPEERIRVTAGRTSANIRITPNPDKPTSPVANIRINLDSLNFRQQQMVVRMNKSELNFALKPQNPPTREGRTPRDTTLNQGERQQRVRDTSEATRELRRLQQIARLQEMSSDEFVTKLMGYMDVLGDTNVDIAQKFMNEFVYEGSLKFDTFRMRMPEFPLPIQVLSSEVHLTPQTLSLNNATIIMGDTDMTTTGSIENFRRALAGRGTLRGHLDIKSRKIEGNQLMYAMAYEADTTAHRQRGSGEGRRNREPELTRFEKMDNERRAARGEQPERRSRTIVGEIVERIEDIDLAFVSVPDSVIKAENNEDNSMFEVTFETPETASLFIVPKNLALTINAKIDTLIFGNGIMTNLFGEAEIRDEHILLNHFDITNGAGEMHISLAYKAISLQEASAWMDVQINKTDIQNLLELYPEFADSIMPLARSFRGLIDCHLTTSTMLDSAMNVDLDRTLATINLRGENVVLLEGEALATIAKQLRFKNRKENIIDSLSVDLVVNNGKIEIFPFRLAMDRWTFAVAGTQDLDMNLDYHITVLQSPWFVPFKLGIDVYGPVENFRWRLTTPKFRNMDSPAVSMELRNRTISVQGEVRRLLEHEFNQIVGRNPLN
jgi:hypothetical protein